jgi:hypothetical protein
MLELDARLAAREISGSHRIGAGAGELVGGHCVEGSLGFARATLGG